MFRQPRSCDSPKAVTLVDHIWRPFPGNGSGCCGKRQIVQGPDKVRMVSSGAACQSVGFAYTSGNGAVPLGQGTGTHRRLQIFDTGCVAYGTTDDRYLVAEIGQGANQGTYMDRAAGWSRQINARITAKVEYLHWPLRAEKDPAIVGSCAR